MKGFTVTAQQCAVHKTYSENVIVSPRSPFLPPRVSSSGPLSAGTAAPPPPPVSRAVYSGLHDSVADRGDQVPF
jgi:hypothetical protein